MLFYSFFVKLRLLIINIFTNQKINFMKKLFLLLFVSMGYFFSSYGQEKLTFSKVIEVKDVDKTSIYISLRDWISTYYRDTQEVL